MCDSNPTRICASVAKKNLKAASDSWNARKDSTADEALSELKTQLHKAIEDFDETRGGQQILASQIKKASSDEEKEKFQIRKDVAYKRRQQKNKEAVSISGKTCYKCKEKKTIDNFDIHSKNPDGLQATCKACRVSTNKKYYLETPDKNIARMSHRTRRNILIQEITIPLLKKGCYDCKKFHENAMEFDHVKGEKLVNISEIAKMRVDDKEMVSLLKEELQKCEVRCVNCHKKETYARQRINKRRTFLINPNKVPEKQRYIYQNLVDHGCIDCKNKDLDVLEFDHVNGSKILSIGIMAQQNFSLKQIDEEIAKCEVRCGNCHRKKTIARARKKETTDQDPKYIPTKFEVTCSCGNKKSFNSKACNRCNKEPRIEWPELEILIEMIKDDNFVKVGKMLGVSDNAIRKFLKARGIDPKEVRRKHA